LVFELISLFYMHIVVFNQAIRFTCLSSNTTID